MLSNLSQVKQWKWLVLFLIINRIYAQSTSVFDACYFKKDNMEPPLKLGKGFHINDVFRQTNYCFTQASCNPTRLKAQGANQNATINFYYTSNDEQFNKLRNTGSSGKISFLNLFSVGTQEQESTTSRAFHNTERVVLIARVDFGVYSYDNDLALTPEAKNLIVKNKAAEFVNAYGTHYISGVRKENSIWLILTKTSSGTSNKQKNKTKTGFSASIPYKVKGSLEISEGNETEELLNSTDYGVSVEVNGPPLKDDLVKSIQNVLNNGEKNKLNAIKSILTEALRGLSDPKLSRISQYYYTPFALKGLKGIYWDERKQAQLIRINEEALKIFALKSQLEPLASFSGQSILSDQFDADVINYSKKNGRKTELLLTYKRIQPGLKACKLKLDTFLVLLEVNYTACSDVFCNMVNCCNGSSLVDKIDEALYEAKGKLDTLEYAIRNAGAEAFEELPSCERDNISTITIINTSLNPYDLYNGEKFIETLPGRMQTSLKVHPGTYRLIAVQQSGYLFYATRNVRDAAVQKACEDISFTIGYED